MPNYQQWNCNRTVTIRWSVILLRHSHAYIRMTTIPEVRPCGPNQHKWFQQSADHGNCNTDAERELPLFSRVALLQSPSYTYNLQLELTVTTKQSALSVGLMSKCRNYNENTATTFSVLTIFLFQSCSRPKQRMFPGDDFEQAGCTSCGPTDNSKTQKGTWNSYANQQK